MAVKWSLSSMLDSQCISSIRNLTTSSEPCELATWRGAAPLLVFARIFELVVTSFTIFSEICMHARWVGSSPALLIFTVRLRFLLTRYCTTSRCWYLQARCSGVFPSLFCCTRLQCFFSDKYVKISTWPYLEATCTAVSPLKFVVLRQQLCSSIMNFTNSAVPYLHAKWSTRGAALPHLRDFILCLWDFILCLWDFVILHPPSVSRNFATSKWLIVAIRSSYHNGQCHPNKLSLLLPVASGTL